MALPNFLVCGIQKGGTTALFEYLRQHPDVFCSARKELCFFDQNWARGRGWYEAHFEGSAGALAVGEASPHYMRSEEVALRIRGTLGKPRLLFILRDPVQRAFSNYNYNLGRGQQDPAQSFEAAIATQDGAERYLDKGHYARDLARYEAIFGRESMLVLFAEELRADPATTLARAFDFIGVDKERWTPTELTSNATRLPAPGLTQAALFRWGQVRRHLQPLVPAPLARATRRLRQLAHQSLPQDSERPTLSAATRQRLEASYAESNQALATWLGPDADLPAWLARSAAAAPAPRDPARSHPQAAGREL